MYKALYPARALSWKEVSVVRPAGSPKPALLVAAPVDLPPHLASDDPTFHLSISHDGDYLVAYVIATTSLLPSSA